MNFSDKSLHLTYDEFYTLMCLLGAKSIQGTFFENYNDTSSNDFDNVWENCKSSLSAKGYMTLEDEDVQLDVSLYSIITACVNAERKYSVQLSRDKANIIDTVFYDGTKSMICINNCDEKKEIYLSYSTKKKSFDNVIKEIPNITQNIPEEITAEITLSQQEYFTLMSSVNMGDYTKARNSLADSVQEDYLMDLMNALKKSYGMLSVTEFQDDEISNYSILFGESYFWAIYAQDEEKISFKLISKKDLIETIAQTFDYDGGVNND